MSDEHIYPQGTPASAVDEDCCGAADGDCCYTGCLDCRQIRADMNREPIPLRPRRQLYSWPYENPEEAAA
jgi:hypothetical protein